MNMEQEKAPKQEGAGGTPGTEERRGGERPEERSVAMLAKTRGRNSDGKCLTAAWVRAHLRASVSVCDPDLVHVFGCETKKVRKISGAVDGRIDAHPAKQSAVGGETS